MNYPTPNFIASLPVAAQYWWKVLANTACLHLLPGDPVEVRIQPGAKAQKEQATRRSRW